MGNLNEQYTSSIFSMIVSDVFSLILSNSDKLFSNPSALKEDIIRYLKNKYYPIQAKIRWNYLPDFLLDIPEVKIKQKPKTKKKKEAITKKFIDYTNPEIYLKLKSGLVYYKNLKTGESKILTKYDPNIFRPSLFQQLVPYYLKTTLPAFVLGLFLKRSLLYGLMFGTLATFGVTSYLILTKKV